MTKTKDDHGLNNAKGHFTSILEYYDAWENAYANDDYDMIEKTEESVRQEALGLAWRCAGWQEVGDTDFKPDQGVITLTCGGPALQLLVDLDRGLPCNPKLQYQDWFTPWTDLTYGSYDCNDVVIDHDKGEAVLQWFASQFYWENNNDNSRNY